MLGDHKIKKIFSKTSIFELPKVKDYISMLRRGPIYYAIIGGNSHFASLARVLTGLWQTYTLQKMSLRVLVGIYCHNPHSHPSEWAARGQRGRQNRQHSKNG